MTKHIKTTIIRIGNQWDIRMLRSYERQFGGGTYEREITLFSAEENFKFLFEQIQALAKSFPVYNPIPEVLDPVRKSTTGKVESLNIGPDLYP